MFVLAYYNTEGNNQVSIDSFKKCFLPSIKMENHNFEFDVRNFYDQSINDSIKQYDKLGKYQQDKVIITQLIAYWVLPILKKITD